MALNEVDQDVGSINLFRNCMIFEIAILNSFSLDFFFPLSIMAYLLMKILGVRLHGFNYSFSISTC